MPFKLEVRPTGYGLVTYCLEHVQTLSELFIPRQIFPTRIISPELFLVGSYGLLFENH